MLTDERGFSLVELIVATAIFVIVIAITGSAFDSVMKNVSHQSKIAESNIEGVLGLDMMRKDIASAGYGLPWSFQSAITYQEVNGTEPIENTAASFNNASNVPTAVFGGNNLGTTVINGSDYLVIRATSIGSDQVTKRWSYMNYTGMTKPTHVDPVTWPKENLSDTDGVIVVRVGLSENFTKELVVFGTTFHTTYGNLANFEPTERRVTHYIYGVGTGDLRMPFNRADYYARIPAASDVPQRCAPNTGILYKATVNQSDGKLNEMPLLDCVADMQVVYTLDTTGSGTLTETDALSGLSAEQIRQQLKTVKVYVLTHEGGKDRYYNYPNSKILVGPNSIIGREFDLDAVIGTGYQNYRWKVYFMTVNPANINITTQ